jgi:hypothetical protein
MTASVLSLGLVGVVAQAERPHVRDTKGSGVTFHAASHSPAQGLRKATLAGEVIYVSPAPVANSMDILDTGAEGDGLAIRLSGDAANRLARQGDQVAIFVNDKLVSAGPVGTNGRVTVNGLSAEQADRISRAVQGQAIPVAGPVLTVVPAGVQDGLHLVDLFVQGVDDLRTYQVGLVTGGGESGRLELEQVIVDRERPDYVFGAAEIVDASSPRTGTTAVVLYQGSIQTQTPLYLGTYAFRPTADANGTFRINVDLGNRTLLATEENEQFGYSSGADARITVGEVRPSRNDR